MYSEVNTLKILCQFLTYGIWINMKYDIKQELLQRVLSYQFIWHAIFVRIFSGYSLKIHAFDYQYFKYVAKYINKITLLSVKNKSIYFKGNSYVVFVVTRVSCLMSKVFKFKR